MITALRGRCEASAVEERLAPFSWWAYDPRPFPREMAGEDPLRGSGQDARLGMDAMGRVVFQHLRDDLFQLYEWTGAHCDLVEINDVLRKLRRFVFAGGVLVEEIVIENDDRRLDGRPCVDVTRWFYEHDRPCLAIRTYESGAHPGWGGPERGPYWRAEAYTFTYDEGDELSAITRLLGRHDIADGGDVEDAQAEARAGLPQDFEASPVYDARTQRRERELPDPDRAYEGLGKPLADAIFAALEQQRDALGPLEFLLVAPGGQLSRAVAADATFIARALRMTSSLREMLKVAYNAQGTVLVDAHDTAPPDVLRRLRAGRQALDEHHDSSAPTRLVRETVTALQARDWPMVAPAFVIGPWGQEAVLKRFAGRFNRPRLARRLQPRDRDELAALLVAAGLSVGEAATVSADAQWGILLQPGGAGVSRLGGAPVLAAGTSWPYADHRPLTHLATIALDELPAVDGREHLPDNGLLSFFADLDFLQPIEPGDQTRGDLAAVIHTPAGASTHEPTPPGEVLDEQRVAPVARLQLRHFAVSQGPELDALAAHAVQRLTGRINGPNAPQLLGHPQPVQEDPRKPGQIVLFHIAEIPGLDFAIMDAGDIHFLGTPDTVQARRWDQLTVIPDSC